MPRKNGGPKRQPDGRYVYRVLTPPNPLGQRKQLKITAPTERLCIAKAKNEIDQWTAGITTSRRTFSAFLADRFWPEYPAARSLKPGSIQTLRHNIGTAEKHLGSLPLAAIDASAIPKMITTLRSETASSAQQARELAAAATDETVKGLAPATVEGAIKILDGVISFAAAEGLDATTRFEFAALRFLERPIAASSRRTYSLAVRRHLLPYLATAAIGQIDERRIAALKRSLLAGGKRRAAYAPGAYTRDGRPKKAWEVARDNRRGGHAGDVERPRLSDRTIRHIVVAARSVLGWAETTKEIPRAPKIPLPKVGDARIPVPYTRDEARALIAAAADDTDRALFLISIDAGLRVSELIGLQWPQIDRAPKPHAPHGEIVIDRQLDGDGKIETTKSRRRRRVPMTDAVRAALDARQKRPAARRSLFVFFDEGSDDDGSPLRRWHVRQRFEAAIQRAGLRKVRWHDHRHFFASYAAVNPWELQALLGHADIRTTQGYVHTQGAPLRSVLDAA